MKTCLLFFLPVLILIQAQVDAQPEKNLAELLGYGKDTKLLIIHADDMGLSESVNRACKIAYEDKSITSGSIMVPCPWSYEMISYLRNNLWADAGIHLTLTAEWKYFKWDGVMSADSIGSLLDSNGYFYSTVEEVGKYADPGEAETELTAQVERAVGLGIRPTHIDTHMGSVMATPGLMKVYMTLSEKYRLPVLFPREYLNMLPPDVASEWGKKIFLLDNLYMLDPAIIDGSWLDAYRKGIESLKPGLNQIIVHIGLDNDEMRSITQDHDDFGSEWRQNDFDVIRSSEFRDLLKQNNIILIGWGQIRDLMQ